MKNILILNGSPRRNGKTASLIEAFTSGAESSRNNVNNLYLDSLNIHGCLACEACQSGNGCVQQDDMDEVYQAFEWADVVVFASPMYWGTVTGQLKIVIDRLYGLSLKMGFENFVKETALIMTARGDMYQFSLDFYHIFTGMLNWKDKGTVLGAGLEEEARKMGENI